MNTCQPTPFDRKASNLTSQRKVLSRKKEVLVKKSITLTKLSSRLSRMFFCPHILVDDGIFYEFDTSSSDDVTLALI